MGMHLLDLQLQGAYVTGAPVATLKSSHTSHRLLTANDNAAGMLGRPVPGSHRPLTAIQDTPSQPYTLLFTGVRFALQSDNSPRLPHLAPCFVSHQHFP